MSKPSIEIERKKRLILWIGVVGLTTIIFTMWFLNTKILLYHERNVAAPPNPLTAVKADFREIMDLFKDNRLSAPSLLTATTSSLEMEKKLDSLDSTEIKKILSETLLLLLASSTPTTTVTNTTPLVP